jgi:drug/metabolite transporter superfamily protein YnfA
MRTLSVGPALALVLFVVAAALEVGGDALIRSGLRREGIGLIVVGAVVLGGYGVVVNLLPIDFSRLLGAYVGIFAVVSVLVGRFVFAESIPRTTWLGLVVILAGSAIIHWGGRM